MQSNQDKAITLEGGCLCSQVKYRIIGPRRHVINCHCANCRRSHGHVAAYTSVNKQDLILTRQVSLKWYHDQSPNTWRGFCVECGSSLFWDARKGDDKISVAAGSLDASHGLRTIGHIYLTEAGDYYKITDSLPRFEKSSEGQLEINHEP
jgi:hypothetical protein